MRKIYTISLLLAASAIVFPACSLKEDPKTMVSETVAFSTKEALEANMYGCYRGLLGGSMITGDMNEYLHPCSGLLTWNGSSWALTEASEIYRSMMSLTQFSNNPNAYSEFKAFYNAISRCNSLIEGLPDSPVEESFKKEIEAEALFVRAICYYYLVRQWGSVPVYKQSVRNMEEASAPRTLFSDVFAMIIEDFKAAEAEMRDYNRVKEVSGIYGGRACKWAATAFLSEVYLYIGTLMEHPDDNYWNPAVHNPDWTVCGVKSAREAFEKAMKYADDVIADGPYRLASKFSDLFDWGNPKVYDSPERIFTLTNTNSVTTGNYTEIRTMPEFPEGTLDSLTINKQYGRWRPDRWTFQVWGALQGGSLGQTDVSEEIYVDIPDPRAKTTIWYGSYFNLNEKVKYNLYPSDNRSWRLYIQYELFFKKYLDPVFNVTTGNADFYVIRLAEMYLNSAEAAAHLSYDVGDEMWQKAFDRIEEIHARARVSVPDGSSPAIYPKWDSDRFSSPETTPLWDDVEMAKYGVSFNSHDALISGIFWERMFELLGEGHEFYDTHRMGATWLRDNIIIPRNAFLRRREQQWENKNMMDDARSYNMMMFGDKNFQYFTAIGDIRKSLLSAFPRDEFVYSKMLNEATDQNDYYWK